MRKGFVLFMLLLLFNLGNLVAGDIKIVISPNPASSQITITTNNAGGLMKIELISMLGSKMLEKTVEGQAALINVEEIPDGIYLIRTTIGTETTVKRVKIQH